MSKSGKFAGERVAMDRERAKVLSCGRTISEEIESIRKYGNHGMSPVLRAAVLSAHGFPKPKAKAENGIFFGCYRPFTNPFLLRDYITLLDLLSVDHTHFDREYCCGWPLIVESTGEELDRARTLSLEFNQLNLDLARQKGATTLAYCCVGCAHAAKHAFKDTADTHVYIVDLILDKIDNRRLKMKPAVIGYFEGCHTIHRELYPGTFLNWNRYRRQLDGIEGLKVVDLPKNLCCKNPAADVMEKAADLNLDKIVCTCNWCYNSLKEKTSGGLHVMSLPQLLLQCLENH
ncbi:conserved hypothetical protein [Syntrophobacter sp. SbD1]|nr:conserved hypothetical protein [Syntrophobacter sp. SbD1]